MKDDLDENKKNFQCIQKGQIFDILTQYLLRMASARENCIRFQLHFKVRFSQAVYLVLHCDEYRGIPIRMVCREMDHDHVWQSEHILFSSQRSADQIVKYAYFVSDYELRDDSEICWVKWEDEDTLMELEFQRNQYMEAFCLIKDRCDGKKVQFDERGRPYKHIQEKRFQRKPMNQTVSVNCRMRRNVAQGRWIYSMLMPDPNEIIEGDRFLEAERMERIRLQGTSDCIWKMSWIFTLEELENLGGSFNIAFFNSYYFKQMKKFWEAILPDGKKGTLEEIAKMLSDQGIPYEILLQSEDQKHNKQLRSQDARQVLPLPIKFVYEVSSDIDPATIFCVCVVSQTFGREKMIRSRTKSRFWETEIQIEADLLEGLKYFFEVNILDRVSNMVHVSREEVIVDIRRAPVLINSSASLYRSYSTQSFGNVVHQQRNSGKSYSWAASNAYNQGRSYFSTSSSYYLQQQLSPPMKSTYTYISRTRQPISYSRASPNPETVIEVKNTVNQSTSNINRVINSFTSASSARSQTVKSVAKFVNDVDTTISDIYSLKEARNHVYQIPQERIINVKVKEYLKPIQLKLVSKTVIEEVIDSFAKEKAKLVERYPQISQSFKKLKSLKAMEQNKEGNILSNNFSMFIIEMTTAVKSWGKNKSTDAEGEKIVAILKKYFTLPEQKEDIGTICYYLNYYMAKEKQYTCKVAHLACQQNFQTVLYQDKQQKHKGYLRKMLDRGCIKGYDFVQNNSLYLNLAKLIDGSFHEIKTFASRYGINLNFNNQSDMLMRTLINYALVYSLCRFYKCEQFVATFSAAGCGELGPFCSQTGQFSTQFLLKDLQAIRLRYTQQNSSNFQNIEKINQQMVKVQEEVVQEIQNATDKELVQLINVEFELNKIQQEFQKNGKCQMQLDVMMDEEAEYVELLDKVDVISNMEEKFAKVRSLLDHKYLKTVANWK